MSRVTISRSAEDVIGRMHDMVGSVALLSAELHTAQRQNASLLHLLASAEARIGEPHAAEPALADELQRLRAHLQGFGAASAQQLRELRELDAALTRQRHGASPTRSDEDSDDQSPECADPPVAPGSAAIRLARKSRAVAQRLQTRLVEVEVERDHLADRLEAETSSPVMGALPASVLLRDGV